MRWLHHNDVVGSHYCRPHSVTIASANECPHCRAELRYRTAETGTLFDVGHSIAVTWLQASCLGCGRTFSTRAAADRLGIHLATSKSFFSYNLLRLLQQQAITSRDTRTWHGIASDFSAAYRQG